jgi:hypothetical protein
VIYDGSFGEEKYRLMRDGSGDTVGWEDKTGLGRHIARIARDGWMDERWGFGGEDALDS